MTGTTVLSGSRCFELTDAYDWQGGGLWFRHPIDLSEPFSIEIRVMLGCDDEGADGMVFILHPELTTGSRGEGMGFGRLYPSFGIEMDTYQNEHLADPEYDHVAFMQHGSLFHYYGITGPVPLSKTSMNVEDCKGHRVRIDWDPEAQWVDFFFDGSLRIRKEIDLINELFDGIPRVYWGFTSATGAKRNKHLVCVDNIQYTESFSLSARDQKRLLDGRQYIITSLDFPSGSTKIPDEATTELDKLVQLFRENPEQSIIIDGYTDSSGSAASNEKISGLRAKSVAEYFMAKGIPESRIQYYGNGERNPIAPNDTQEGRNKNRRVEVTLKIIKV